MAGRFSAAMAIVMTMGCGAARPPVAPPAPLSDASTAVEALSPADAPIAFRRSAVADHYFWLRVKVLEGDVAPEFLDALAAMRDLRAELSEDPTAWEDLDIPLGRVRSAAELTTAYSSLPASRLVGGKTVPLRAVAVRVARAMEATTTAFREGPYRVHAEAVGSAARDLVARMAAHQREISAAIDADMGLSGHGVGRPIVLTLVGDAPYPAVFAADARGLEMASFVSVRGLNGGSLVETVLQESLHAVDEITVREPTAMNKLRAALARHGIDATDPSVEMAVNTVTAAEAASLVRRFVDPAHRALGESGFYVLFPAAPAIVAAWERHLGGEGLDATAEAIARAVSGP